MDYVEKQMAKMQESKMEDSKRKDVESVFSTIFDLLPAYGRISANSIPVITSAVYFLYRNETIVYVGQSTCLFSRIGSHIKEGRIDFDAFGFLKVKEQELNEVESKWISILKPEYNRTCIKASDSPIDRILNVFDLNAYKRERHEPNNLHQSPQ